MHLFPLQGGDEKEGREETTITNRSVIYKMFFLYPSPSLIGFIISFTVYSGSWHVVLYVGVKGYKFVEHRNSMCEFRTRLWTYL